MAQPPAPLAFFTRRARTLPIGCIAFITWFAQANVAPAQVAWSGLTKSFTKLAFTDHTLPANQDALTANVVLTRGGGGGLINIIEESFYTSRSSPESTEWATDFNNAGKSIAATNGLNLLFTNWIDAYGGEHSRGAFIAGRKAVVHLISDNVYLDLQFTSWTPGTGAGYSYLRAEPPGTPLPTGDYNGNHLVDAADYVAWRDTFGQPAVPAGSGADGNSSGTIDDGDYSYWKERFGNPVPGAMAGLSTTVVPEPATVGISMWWISFALGHRRRRPSTSH